MDVEARVEDAVFDDGITLFRRYAASAETWGPWEREKLTVSSSLNVTLDPLFYLLISSAV